MSLSKPVAHIRVSQETWLPFVSAVITRIKNDENGARVFASLRAPMVDQAAFFALNPQGRSLHLMDDAVISYAIMSVTHPDDAWVVAKFLANTESNDPPPNNPPQGWAPGNPDAPSWWCSSGRKSLDYLTAKYSGVSREDVAKLRSTLNAISLGEFKGDVSMFASKFSSVYDRYMTAATSAGVNTVSADYDLALHLVDEVLPVYDEDLYGTMCTMLRHSTALTVEATLKAAERQYRSKVFKQDHSDKKSPTALITDTDPSGGCPGDSSR